MTTALVTNETQTPTLSPPRLPYHPAVEERFGVDKASWKALVEAVFPTAESPESVILVLSYCKARKLDPFKKPVHIVPVWSKAANRMVDTVWPGIGELRTTAFRTGLYAGRDATQFGPVVSKSFGKTEMEFPEWAQVTVYRMVGGERRAYQGPPVYWEETYATAKRDDPSPNAMWKKRPRGQLDKCAEAAALRAAFPEELGDIETDSEAFASQPVIDVSPEKPSLKDQLENIKDKPLAPPQTANAPADHPEAAPKAQAPADDAGAAQPSEGPTEPDYTELIALRYPGLDPNVADILHVVMQENPEATVEACDARLRDYSRKLKGAEPEELDENTQASLGADALAGRIQVTQKPTCAV